MSTMQISIIITHYQKIYFLLPLLNYLLQSISKNISESIEIIIVDNYSLDSEKLKPIAGTFKASLSQGIPIQFLFLDQNYGPSYARNRGVEAACGDYIQFLDEDDWFNPLKLSLQYNFAINHGWPSFVTSNWARVSFDSTWDNWTSIAEYLPNFDEPGILSLIKSNGFVPLMAGLVKRSSFLKVRGFKEEMWLVEDIRFLIDLHQVCPHFLVCQTDTPLFFYRIGQPNSLSTGSKRLAFYDACYKNAIQVEQVLSNRGFLNPKNSSTLANIYGGLARFYFEHDRTKFYEILSRIHRLDPNYLPTGPTGLRLLSKWLGYENAESIALRYRQVKSLIRI